MALHPIPRTCAALLLIGIATHAQPAQSDPVFEVASIKRNISGTALGDKGALPGGRLSVRDQTLRSILFSSLNVHYFQILGGPDWMDTEPYDIEAKASATRPSSRYKVPCCRPCSHAPVRYCGNHAGSHH